MGVTQPVWQFIPGKGPAVSGLVRKRGCLRSPCLQKAQISPVLTQESRINWVVSLMMLSSHARINESPLIGIKDTFILRGDKWSTLTSPSGSFFATLPFPCASPRELQRPGDEDAGSLWAHPPCVTWALRNRWVTEAQCQDNCIH